MSLLMDMETGLKGPRRRNTSGEERGAEGAPSAQIREKLQTERRPETLQLIR